MATAIDTPRLSISNPDPQRQDGPSLLHQLVQRPCDDTAIEFLDGDSRTCLSYWELHREAEILAQRITATLQNPTDGFVVPLLIRQSPLLYVAQLAILKAGGAFCPLNIDAPPDRVRFILNDVSARVVITSADLRPSIPEDITAAVLLADEPPEETSASQPHPRHPIPSDLAYVMYTSGSTGTPKGVGLSHDAVTQALLAHQRHIPPFSRFLQFAAPTFDVSVFEIFFPLLRGSTLIAVRRQQMLDDLPGVLARMEVDACELTPTVAGSLLRKRENAPRLELLLTIGEMLTKNVVEEFGGREGRRGILWAMYGPTEATIHCTLQPAIRSDSPVANIGVPLDTVSCFVIPPSEDSRPGADTFEVLPLGQVGELAVGGHQLATEYLNRAEQTRAAFIDSPYGRLYRTGDKARMLEDGTLECLGRLSEGQVKLRGQRMELGEVEQAVLRAEGCHGAVAAVMGSILVVFCTVDDERITEEAVLSTCRRWLPQFMVPSEVVILSEFPRLPSGKVDRKRLKADFESQMAQGQDDDSEGTAAVGAVEGDIMSILDRCLGTRVSLDRSLASVGLDSLKAIQAASLFRESGFQVTTSELLGSRTVSDLVARVAESRSPSNIQTEAKSLSLYPELKDILEANNLDTGSVPLVQDVLPCTGLQVAMLAETAQDPQLYCNSIELEIDPTVSHKAVIETFRQLASRNELMRAGFLPWKRSFVMLVFEELDSRATITNDELDHKFSLDDGSGWLRPLRLQLCGSKALLHIHHALYDGWSLDGLLADWSALLRGQALDDRPSFRRIIEFDTSDVRQRMNDNAKSFWSGHLLGWNKAPFPRLQASPPEDTHNLSRHTINLSVETVSRASAAANISPQVFFQAAMAIIWSRILGHQDIVIGSVTSGRTVPVSGIDKIFGPCIASLPLRVDFESVRSVADLLNNIHGTNRAVLDHCTLSLLEIRKLLGMTSAEPLYDVLLVYQESLESGKREENLLREVRHLDRLETKVLVEVEPRGEVYSVCVTQPTSHVPHDLLGAMMAQMETVLGSMIHTPDMMLDNVVAEEARLSPSVYNMDIQQPPMTISLADSFHAAASKCPESTALSFVSRDSEKGLTYSELSYRALSHRANQVAHWLISSGVNTGDVVAIVMDKSVDLYVCILGIIKAGCGYLPVLPSNPQARIQEIFRQAQTKHCIVDSNSLATLNPIKGSANLLLPDTKTLDSYPTDNPTIPTHPDSLAYVIYTSGTTGVPKGVAVTSRNIASNITHLASLYPFTKSSKLLQACSQAFDVSVFEIFFTWHAGLCLCAGTNDVIFEDLEETIRRWGVTHLSLTPTVAALVNPQTVPSVDFLVTAGEPMTRAVADAWEGKLWQGYGPSETTNICSVKRMRRGGYIEHLGWTFPNTSVVVLPPGGVAPVPLGWVGEFCFGGEQVAQGYLNDTALTEKSFITHPQFDRIYRSGDIGRMLPDGSLVILGRLDDQVKLRGQRVEASEVNSSITSSGLAEAAVTMVLRLSESGREQLVSYYVPGKEMTEFEVLSVDVETNRSLYAQLRSKLPGYMVPSFLVPVSRVPLTSSGKVDRRCLASTFADLSTKLLRQYSPQEVTETQDSEWTNMERLVAATIESCLDLETGSVGKWTPFPTLGLDSVTAIGAAREVSRRLEQIVPLSAFVQSSSVAQLVKHIEDRNTQAPAPEASPLDPSTISQVREQIESDGLSIEDILPCTPLQEGMLVGHGASYFNKTLLRLKISPVEMQRCWERMTQRHQILRTCFRTTNSTSHPIVQIVLRDWTVSWKTYEAAGPSFQDVTEAHLKTITDPLNSKSPPFSLALITYRSSTFLSLVMHHALYDGVAMESLWREVEALSAGKPLPRAVPFSSFVNKTATPKPGADAFWARQFRSYQPAVLFAQPRTKSHGQAKHTASLGLPLEHLRQRLQKNSFSLLALCQASWARTVALASGLEDVCIGNVLSGRTVDLEGIDRLVGPCFNTVPIRSGKEAISQNASLVKHMAGLHQEMLEYQYTPLRKIQQIADTGGRPLFDTLLLLQQPLREMDESVWTLEEDVGDMDIPLVCEVVPCPELNSVIMHIHYEMDSITEGTAMGMLGVFQCVMRDILDRPFSMPMGRKGLPERLGRAIQGLEAKVYPRQKEQMISRADDEGLWLVAEQVIRQALSDLSGVPLSRISRGTTIFQLGLDSINAIQVATSLRKRGMNVTSADILESRTCAGIATRSKQNEGSTAPGRTGYDLNGFRDVTEGQVRKALGEHVRLDAVLPCTPMQCAMITAFQQSEGRDYLNSVVYKIDNSVSVHELAQAWKKVQRAHQMLRTGFQPVQHPDCTFAMVSYYHEEAALPLITWEHGTSQFDPVAWKDAARREIHTSLLQPPWRVALVAGKSTVNMHLLMHHALYDAQSLDMILRDLAVFLRPTTTAHKAQTGKIGDAVASIMETATRDNDYARAFYSGKASSTIVNAFPILTPLRVAKRAILVHEQALSYGFKDFQKAVQSQNLTVQAVMQAAWVRVLSSYIGEPSVVFGVTLSGRTAEATSTAAFPCITTIPVVAVNKPSNRHLLNDMMDYALQAHKHQHVPLGQVQKWLGHPAAAVFDTLLAYQRTAETNPTVRPWRAVADDARVEYPVSVEVEPNAADQVIVRITYFDDVLPSEQASLMARQIQATMEHLAMRPDGMEQDLCRTHPGIFSVTPAQHQELQAPVQYLHQFVERAALLTPDKVALEFVSGFKEEGSISRSWTYKQLNDMGNRVVNKIKHKATPGSIVAIHFDKCPEAYFSILGILKAGCAFVALDITAPAARREFILQDSEAPCILTSAGSTLNLDTSASTIQISEDILLNTPSEPVSLPSTTVQDTCYCLYTSGTTGTPKGCEITHQNAVQAMLAFQHLFRPHWDPGSSRWLQFAALHFDVSVLEQYWSWSVGITVVAAPRDLILDDLTGNIHRMGITHIDLTPSLARLTDPASLPNLCKGVFITGGESLKQEILDVWGPEGVIYNAYGPTEATIGVTMYQRVPQSGRPSNIGRQFPNVGSYVFAPGTEVPVLRGGVGELCVSGKLVGKGYLKRPELTKERFPYLEEFQERVYRTGDLVRILHDGCFEFLGRADDQVKLRGQRLEIGEINHAIRSQVDAISDVATVVARHGTSGKDVLVSFFVTEEGDKATPLEVLTDDEAVGVKARSSCREKLPGYMVPSYFLRVGYIPLSSNNKAEGKVLRGLFQGLTHEELGKLSVPSYAHGRTSSAAGTSKLISALEGFHLVSESQTTAETSLFDIGVDSISALQLSLFLKERGFPQATPAMILRNPMIADLAEALNGQSRKTDQFQGVREARQSVLATSHRYRSTVCRALDVSPAEVEYIAPCSALQQGILSKAMTSEEKGAYFNAFTLTPAPGLDMGRMKSAWAELVSSEAILRTEFVETQDGFVQVALKNKSVPWLEENCPENVSKHDFLDKKRKDWIGVNDENVTRPLELLVVPGQKDVTIVIHIFHAIYDGNSFDLMLERLRGLYAGHTVPSGPSYLDAMVHGPLQRHDFCRPFWTEFLSGWTPSMLPRLSDDKSETLSAKHVLDLNPVDQVRRRANVTLQSVLLAAWTSVLQRHLKSQTATIGVIMSGRSIDLPDVDRTIGPLFNTLPFFNAALAGRTWRALIHSCHSFHAEVLPFQHVPLKSVQKWCSRGAALFDNLFAFQVEPSEVANGESLWSVDDGGFNADYPLALEATRSRDGKIRLVMVAQSGFADEKMLEGWLDDVVKALSAMSRDLDALIDPDSKYLQHKTDAEVQSSLFSQKKESVVVLESAFEWTSDALALRTKIASLAGMSDEQVTHTVTLTELGLDSVDVVKLSSQLKLQGITLPASKMTRLQTIAAMVPHFTPASDVSAAVDGQAQQYQALKSQCLEFVQRQNLDDESDIEDVIPPTALQESMLAGMLQSSFEQYFNHDILEIHNDVDLERLKSAWNHVVEACPILRVGAVEVDDQDIDLAYCLVIRRSINPFKGDLHFTSLSQASSLFSEAKELAVEGKGLRDLFQLRVAHMGDRHFILLSLSHALYDGWSLSLMFKLLKQAYEGEALNPTPLDTLLPKTMDDAPSSSASGTFWTRYLENAPPTLLTPLRNNPQDTSLHEKQLTSSTPLTHLKQFCKSRAIGIQTLCQATWAALLAHQTRNLDISFGVVLSGRDFPGAEDLVFPTINTVTLRCILHGSSADLLRYLEESTRDVRDHQRYPLRKALQSGGRHAELFNSLFMMQKKLDEWEEPALLSSVDGKARTDYPVCVEAEVVGDALLWRVACQSGYFTEETTAKLLGDIDRVLSFLTSSESQHVLDFTADGVSICGLPAVQLRDQEETFDARPEDRTTLEQMSSTAIAIRDILSKVSHIPVESIDPSSTLYSLGLDSISAIKVSLLLRKEGIELRPRELLRAQSINEMAQFVDNDNLHREEAAGAISKWQPPGDVDLQALLSELSLGIDNIEITMPALAMQIYMLSTWENSSHSVFFPEFCFEVRGVDHPDVILRAWQTLQTQLPILRTVFLSTGLADLPFIQAVLKDSAVSKGRDAQPFVQVRVEKQDGNPSLILKLKIHHALYDGVSLPNILHRLISLIDSQPPQVEESLSLWTQQCIQPTLPPARHNRQLFWVDHLRGCSTTPFTLPVASSSASHERVSSFREAAIPTASTLQHIATTHRITIQSLLFAAHAQVLSAITGQDTVVFGIYMANRQGSAELDTFPTLNLVPLRVSLGGKGLVELAEGIHDDLGGMSSQDVVGDVSLWEIRQWTGVEVTSFVNFLSVPGDEEDTGEISSRNVCLTALKHSQSQEQQDPKDKYALGRPNAVKDAFPSSLDVEIKVRDGGVDIGVFGERGIIDEDGARGWIDKLVASIEALGES